MVNDYSTGNVSSEDRRDFLKALGLTGAVAAGGVTLDEVHSKVATGTGAEELAPVGQAIQADLTGTVDAQLIANQQAALTAAANELPASLERGLPGETEGPREEFAALAEAGQPVYNHLKEVGFYASAAEHLPEFNLETLGTALETFVASEQLVGTVDGFGLGDEQGVDLLATVIGNAEELQNVHWVATEELPGEALSAGEAFPTAPQAAAGGVLLWLDDIDLHLYQKAVLLTDQIHSDAVWHAQSMAAGFQLMSEGAKAIGEESGSLSESELGALLTTSFAVQATSQGLLPQDVYWITEQMRTPRA